MKEKALVSFDVLAGSAVTLVFFFSRRFRVSPLDWILLYVLAVVVPTAWSYRVARGLKRINGPLPHELYWAPYYPVLAAVIALAGVFGLVRAAAFSH